MVLISSSLTANVLYTGRQTKDMEPEIRGLSQSHTASFILFGLRSRLTLVCMVHGQIDSLLISYELQFPKTGLQIVSAFLFPKL